MRRDGAGRQVNGQGSPHIQASLRRQAVARG